MKNLLISSFISALIGLALPYTINSSSTYIDERNKIIYAANGIHIL